MNTRKITAWGLAAALSALGSGVAFADSSYESTTQVTGGALVDTMKSLSFLSKSMKEAFAPVSTMTMVCGNRKATVSKDSTEIIDLDKEEMIQVDNLKKTYTVVTFAQMRQALHDMPQRIQQAQAQAKQQQQQQPQQPKPNLQTSFTVDVKNTGASKEVNGLTAQEQIVTLTMTVTNLDAPANGPNGQTNSMTYVLTTDAWIAPDPPQVKEIADFDVRWGKKMMEGVDAQDVQAWMASMKKSSAQMSQMLGTKPGASDAMAQMGKEMEKIKGTRVLETMSMGGVVPAGSVQNASANAQNGQTNSGGTNSGSVAGQVAGDTATQTAANESNKLGGFGSALGSSVMSAWHRKKANTNTNSNTNANTTANSGTTNGSGSAGSGSGAGSTGQGTQTVVLMATTSQKTNFSAEAVPASVFAIPAGYTLVASPFVNAP